jgi:lambda repressor-like predicted transcriptional regulator
LVELLGRYSNYDMMNRIRQVLAGQDTGRLPARTTRSPHQIQHKLAPDEIERLLEAYRAGTKINDLASEFGIARTTVLNHIARAGLPKRRNFIRDHLDEARELYATGWSLAKVGEHFGVDANTVRYAFRKAGIPRRDAQGR